jgi:hypothetical protein
MATEPKQTAPPAPRETGTVHIKAAQSAQIKLEDLNCLLGDPRKGVGVAATGHPPTSGIFGS